MPDAPKPTAGYIVVSPDWNPATRPTHAWNPHSTLKRAAEDLAFADMVGAVKIILKVQTTYTLVGDDGRG